MEDTTEQLLPFGPGPYLARVVNHSDSSLMGSLEVLLYTGTTGKGSVQGQTVTVHYCPPFAGQTSSEFEGNNSASFQDAQKSYGMWMVPPDVGTTVLVIFVGADINAGYWLGVVPDKFQNHMVPGLASTRYTALTDEQKRKYGTDNLPTAEFVKSSRKIDIGNVDKFTKPVHPFADRLLAQGLLIDDIRGITSSSARREYPSAVFGISTPGPIDRSTDAKQGTIGFKEKVRVYVSRLGGHQLVMDDGDKDGLNELFRIRTRTGHQILLHNSSDLIYIANAAGTAWIELTGQGKIDMYAADSVSIHSEGDFNLRADRDFNIEAGRNLNLVSSSKIQIESGGDTNVISARDINVQAGNDFNLKASSDTNLGSTGEFNIIGTASLKMGSPANVHLISSGVMYQGSTGNFNVTAGGNYYESAKEIHMNGPTADAGTSPTGPNVTASELPRFNLPNRIPGAWSDGEHYSAADIVSIMNRVPTHEPWSHHESINPTMFSSDNTDSDSTSGKSVGTKASVTYTKSPATSPPVKTGNQAEDNIAAFLWTIRRAEGTASANGYRTMYTGKLFEIDNPQLPTYQYKDHPRTVIKATSNGKPLNSSAAGAYQFMPPTWDQCKKALGLPDFSPASQDKAGIYLIQSCNALNDVRAGEFTKAANKVRRIWASFPGANYDQPEKTIAVLRQYFTEGGGTFVA